MNRKQETDDRARAFIDEVIEINRRHGMGGGPSEDTYRDVVKATADAFRSLHRPVPAPPAELTP